MEPDDLPRRGADTLAALGQQDLDPLSQGELLARIAGLEAEIARCRARLAFADRHRAAAEGLFKR